MAHQRTLRILSLYTTVLAFALNIALTAISLEPDGWYRRYREVSVWCFVFIPLALTATTSTFGLLYNRRHGRMPSFRYSLLDFIAAMMYIGLLIPIWAVEIGLLREPGYGLLAGYATAPMILNMFMHIYISVMDAKFLWLWIFQAREHECPNCHRSFTATAPEVQQTSTAGERYSLLRGEDYLDGDAVAYNDARDEEDLVGLEGEVAEQSASTVNKGKGPINI